MSARKQGSSRTVVRFYQSQTPDVFKWLNSQRNKKLSLCLLVRMAREVTGDQDVVSAMVNRGNIFSFGKNSSDSDNSSVRQVSSIQVNHDNKRQASATQSKGHDELKPQPKHESQQKQNDKPHQKQSRHRNKRTHNEAPQSDENKRRLPSDEMKDINKDNQW